MSNIVQLARPVEFHHLNADAERTPPTTEEQSRIEAIGLELLHSGKIHALTPAWLRTIRTLVMAEGRSIRLNRTPSKMVWTQVRHFDVLVKAGVLNTSTCQDTGRQLVSLSEKTEQLLGVVK